MKLGVFGYQDTPAAEHGAVTLLRVWLAASGLSLLGTFLAGILFLAALFSRQAGLGKAALLALAASFVGRTVAWVLRTSLLWKTGSWAGLNGERLTRDEQPRRFVIRMTIHILSSAILIGAAGFLTWEAFS